MQINMATFAARKQHYIDKTLESLFASDWRDSNLPLNLIMGSEDQSHLEQYAREYINHPAVRIVPWDMETHPSLRQNCTLNKIHALRYGDDDETLICEDDIEFKPDWLARLREVVAEIANDDYILSLYRAEDELQKARPVKGKSLICHYPGFILQGAQGIFYPGKALRSKIADFLQKNIWRACGDELIGRYGRSYTDLYSTRQNLLWHIGQISCFET